MRRRFDLIPEFRNGYWVVTCPEIKGLIAIAESQEKATKEALDLIALVEGLDGHKVVVTAVEMDVAA